LFIACRQTSRVPVRHPILVLPDDIPAHPLVSSVDVASFCPNAEITVFPWREPPELKASSLSDSDSRRFRASNFHRGTSIDGQSVCVPDAMTAATGGVRRRF
jgi:hypothetical protein